MCPSPSSEDGARRMLYCLGDSLTFGYGVQPRERWLTLASGQSGWRLMNRGVCGDTTGGMLVRLRELIGGDRKAQAVMLMGGANDIFYSGSELGARANMGAMIQQLLTAGALVASRGMGRSRGFPLGRAAARPLRAMARGLLPGFRRADGGFPPGFPP